MLIDPENPPSRKAEPDQEPKPRARSPLSHRRAPARPPWCGTCHPYTRRLEDPDDGLDLGPCPDCHPTGRTTAA